MQLKPTLASNNPRLLDLLPKDEQEMNLLIQPTYVVDGKTMVKFVSVHVIPELSSQIDHLENQSHLDIQNEDSTLKEFYWIEDNDFDGKTDLDNDEQSADDDDDDERLNNAMKTDLKELKVPETVADHSNDPTN
ncbi:hypothetical protein KQX54_021162 [Cotesia glomerata]|uniref:Uncharacterized protein n=1 Tax=Cotesia glomerata TaxID=32391 RepID=A0AAV7J874_COTGL|nr:hypothetical protein KQX54_021162 [Cotesia glomerata]